VNAGDVLSVSLDGVTNPASTGSASTTVTTTSDTKATTTSVTISTAHGPIVTGVNPPTGFTTGGTSVTITGSGFNGASKVDFDGNAATGVTVIGDSSITAASPPGAEGTVDVTVTTPDGTSSTTPADQFTYTVDQTTPQTLPCTPSCTNTVSTPLDMTSITVTGDSGTSTSGPSTSLLVNTGTLSCGTSKTRNYDYATAVGSLSSTDFPPKATLTITETVGHEPSTTGLIVCFAAGSKSKGTALRPCKASMKAPCVESLDENPGDDVVATVLSPANDPRFWTGGAAVDVTSFSPTKGVPGATVTIKGKNLGQVYAVVLGGAQATIDPTTSTSTKLVVTVPAGAVTGSITVAANSGEVVSTKLFTVT
jgi:hypothetical protein